MSNHRPVNDPGASVASIATGVGLTAAALGAALFILWGPMDARGLTGAGLGLVLAVLLLAQTVARISDRLTARDRIRTCRARQTAEVERLERIAKRGPAPAFTTQAADTAVMDRVADRMAERGWPVPIVQANPGPEYPAAVDPEDDRYPQDPRADYLIQAAEATMADRGHVQSWRTDETQIIDYGPSPAALRPIGVPVFRTEADRARWAHDHDGS